MKGKIIFLDRDGVINKKMPDGDYVKNWAEFEFIPQAIEALKFLSDNGYKIFVITNQRGVARGLMTKQNMEEIHSNMEAELRKRGINIEGIYYCAHNIEDNCECRKPKPGLILRNFWAGFQKFLRRSFGLLQPYWKLSPARLGHNHPYFFNG